MRTAHLIISLAIATLLTIGCLAFTTETAAPPPTQYPPVMRMP